MGRATYGEYARVKAKSNARLRFFCCQFCFPCYIGLHTSRYNAELVVAREGFVGSDLLISALTHTHIQCMCVYI